MAARFLQSGEAGKTAASLPHAVQQAHTTRSLAVWVPAEPQLFVDSKNHSTPFAKQVMAGVFMQLHQLHSQGKAHGNLNPSIVEVTNEGFVELKGCPVDVEDHAEYSSNVFDAGKILHFIVTRGKPQGTWQSNLEDLVGMSLMPSEAHLLRQMLSRDPTERPTMAEALDHPCLWNETNICNFLVYVSDYLQALNKDMTGWPRQLHRCLKDAMQEGNDNWVLGNTKMDMELMRVCRRWRKEISTDNWLHLLRCFRNLYRHYKDLRQPFSLPAIQPLFDWCPEGAYRYFAAMFPKLLITTYSFVQKYCMEDPAFTSGLPMTVHQSRLHGHPPHPQTRTVQPATVVTSRAGICEPRQEMLDAARSTSNLNPDAACWSGAQVNPPTWASAVRGDGNARNQTYSLGSNATALTALTYADALRAAANDTTPEQATGNSDSMASGSSTSEVNSNMSCDSTCSELMLRSSSSSRSSTSGYSQDSMHAKYVSWQPGNRNRRTSHQAVAGASHKARVAALQRTAYTTLQRKEAVRRFNCQKATAYGAACIGRCYELGSGADRNISCAIVWYDKALRLDGRGSIGQHAQLRVAELQQQQHQASFAAAP